MPNMAGAAPLVKSFTDPGNAIREVAVGLCHAGIVRGFMSKAEAEQQAEAILANYDPRTDGVPGGTLGPSLFQHPQDPIEYFRKSALSSARIDQVLGVSHPGKLTAAIKSFEDLGYGYRIKPVVYNGLPAAYNRALIFRSDQPVLVGIHEDVANVRALAPYNFEISGAEIVMAHNLYLQNRPGEGSLYMYGKKFSDQEKLTLEKKLVGTKPEFIAASGFEYPEAEFNDAPTTVSDVEAGDYVVFRADYPHKVANRATFTDGWRVSWNGFFTLLNGNPLELVYWT